MKKKVIHLIPQDGLGGVEQAARSLIPASDLDIKVAFMCGNSLSKNKFVELISKKNTLGSLTTYIKSFKYLLRSKPELLVCSLWKSSAIGLPYYFYRKAKNDKNFKFVLLIHASSFSHMADKIITKMAIHFADEVWCDSKASKEATFKTDKYSNKIKTISFLVKTDTPNLIKRKNNFVYWGRIAKVKRIDKSIILFNKIKNHLPGTLFYIYGPDGGELQNLKQLIKELKLEESVFFMGAKKPNYYPKEILSSKFFLNSSANEGMAIAVTEAMQLGLVPVVTPVGEIPNYCTDNYNSIFFDEEAYQNIITCIDNTSIYDELSENARLYWDKKPDYSQDFNKNCLRLIKQNEL